jgi:hypothetical protein
MNDSNVVDFVMQATLIVNEIEKMKGCFAPNYELNLLDALADLFDAYLASCAHVKGSEEAIARKQAEGKALLAQIARLDIAADWGLGNAAQNSEDVARAAVS